MGAKYITNNEMKHFDFTQAIVVEMKQQSDSFLLILNNVIIKPENSCNRDIWDMSTNNLELTIHEGKIDLIIEEGYRKYDANDVLLEEVEDRVVEREKYTEVLKSLPDAYIFSIDQTENGYVICVDGEEHSYRIEINGSGNTEEWNRFMNKAME